MSAASPRHDLTAFAGRRVFVLGLGRSGQATASALAAAGAEVLAWDDAPEARQTVPAALIRDPAKAEWPGMAALVISPGIPHTHPKPHPAALAAKAAGVPLLGDVELLLRANPRAKAIGVTGTNGKSTTTALIGHALALAGRRVEIGGNLGPAALSLAPLGAEGIYVLELSSYQLELMPSTDVDIAVLLNLSPDHLERHGGMAGYVAAKERILRRKGKDAVGIVGCDDATSCDVFAAARKRGERRLVAISAESAIAGGVHAVDGKLIDDSAGAAQALLDLTQVPTLPGRHNWQNAAAAAAALREAGLSPAEIAAGLRSYPGLPHRQERIAAIAGVAFVNDSKATNAEAAARALACYDDIYWIAGGRAKAGGIAGLEKFRPRIRHAYLIGEAAEGFAAQLGGSVPWSLCVSLDRALAAAAGDAARERRPGAVVLLSPAAASQDQYRNFEERGAHFRALVENLAQAAGQRRGAA